jgi:hypothetical protein
METDKREYVMLMIEYKPAKKILMAGPWQGEFGWEIMRWQGHIRFLAQQGKYDRVYVAIQQGHELLYQDFTQDFIYVNRGINTDGWRADRHTEPVFNKHHIRKVQHDNPFSEITSVNPTWTTCDKNRQQVFVRYGIPKKKCSFDILIHARETKKSKTHVRNWSIGKWKDIADYFGKGRGLRIASIGTTDQAKHIPGTERIMDVSLEQLSNVMASSRLIIGPSSGPMHLATLCGCPQLIWTDKKYWRSIEGNNRFRYEIAWNPFRTKVMVLDDCCWQPQVSEVVKSIKEMLELNTIP